MDTSSRNQACNARGTIRTIHVTSAAPFQLIGPSNARVAVTLFGATSQYTVSSSNAVTSGAGIVIPANSAFPVILSTDYHGDLVKQVLFAIAATVPTDITFIETILQGNS